MRLEDDFVYGNKINKSCIKCRDKRKKNRDKKKGEKPKEPKEEPKMEPKEEPKEEPNDPTNFIRHQLFFKRLNIEFLERAAKPVHVYQMKHVFIDIRDCLIHSDKDFSFTNY
jgi:hypothetical protein